MIKRSYFGWTPPRFRCDASDTPLGHPETVPLPDIAYVFIDDTAGGLGEILPRTGDAVRTGQRIRLTGTGTAAAISPITGTISSIRRRNGHFGQRFVEFAVARGPEEIFDTGIADGIESPSQEFLIDHFQSLPGATPFTAFTDSHHPIHTIVVTGMDVDFLGATRQYVMRNDAVDIKPGIDVLKSATGVSNVVIALRHDGIQHVGGLDGTPMAVAAEYPAGLPRLIMHAVLGITVPAGKTCEEMGVFFISAEAVANIGRAVATRRLPVEKIVTVVDKAGDRRLLRARLGTPIAGLLAASGIRMEKSERLIVGGPMTGVAVTDPLWPVLPDTDMVMVQAHGDIPRVSDYPCINCGECVRICPARVPVNMLIRYLEAGQYQEAADAYDLLSCVDCGLCGFVCPSKIPIFQHIRLAKHELARIHAAEAAHV